MSPKMVFKCAVFRKNGQSICGHRFVSVSERQPTTHAEFGFLFSRELEPQVMQRERLFWSAVSEASEVQQRREGPCYYVHVSTIFGGVAESLDSRAPLFHFGNPVLFELDRPAFPSTAAQPSRNSAVQSSPISSSQSPTQTIQPTQGSASPETFFNRSEPQSSTWPSSSIPNRTLSLHRSRHRGIPRAVRFAHKQRVSSDGGRVCPVEVASISNADS